MELNNSIVFETLDNYLNKLDESPISSNGLFVSESRKEWYETQLMYAFRKYQAAIYHYKNVKKFIIDDEAMMKNSMEHSKELTDKELHGIKGIRSWGSVILQMLPWIMR